MTQTHLLLREYSGNGSEAAFRQIVEQYVDLVFSTALRRLAGDRHRAEDATQIVFTDLARKARTLPADVMLGGWLHRHCCFVVSNLCRADSRRAAREKEAVAMENLHPQEANWSEVAPELDDAINSLQQEDRDAIVLRFFERQDFRAIGEAIGGSENAAQKRVTRALEKLRHLLAERGVALSAAALMTALSSEAIATAPTTLAEKACESALKHTGVKVAALAGGTGGLAIALWSLAAATVIAVVSFAVLKTQNSDAVSTKNGATPAKAPAATAGKVSNKSARETVAASAATNVQTTPEPSGPTLRLTIVAADTGNPVPNVPIEYRATEGKRWVDKSLQSSRAGGALVPFTPNTTELRLTTRTEAFADTRLFWQTKDGSAIPTEYTLRLKRGAPIGGKVINSRGELVPGAVVDFNLPLPDPELSQKTESHEIESVHIIAEDGTWQTSRIPESLLRRMHASASHPDYAGSDTPIHPTPSATIDLFLKAKHVFTLRDGITVRGIVVNKQDEPIPNAKILVGGLHFLGSKEEVTGADGRFEVRGAPPGKTTVTASASGYGASTVAVDSPPREEGYQIVLEPGRLLKLRVVNLKGEPIPKAYAWLKTIDNGIQNPTNAPLVQAEFEGRTDADGRVTWDQAPADELTFDFAANGYMRRVEVKTPADGVEHTITLLSALKIIGDVRDATSGGAVPKFRVVAGWPSSFIPPGQKQQIHWSTIDRHWLHSSNGHFEWALEEPIVFGVDTNRYIFKVEADGYKPFTTRIINEDEGEVHLDIPLQRGDSTMLTILAPDGRPAPDVDVAFPQPHTFLRLGARGFDRNGGGDQIVLSDSKGQVTLPGDEPAKIIAAGPPGFAMINPADLPADGTIRLQPWARVEGKISRRGKPLAGWKLHIGTESGSEPVTLMAGDTVSDDDGTFTINYAPPGHFKLVHLARTDETTAYTHVPIRDLDIAPGQTANGDYEEHGVAGTVRLRWPDDFARTDKHRVFCGASVPFEQPSREMMSDPALAKWRERPDIKAAMAKMLHSTFAETEPGVWCAENLEPGEWTINAMVIEQKQNPAPGQPNPPLLAGVLKAQIPENTTQEKIDLGELLLAKPEAPAALRR